MLGYHDVISRETFVQWIDQQLARLSLDDEEQSVAMDARYADMYGLAEAFAARLALPDVMESLGNCPPPFAGSDRQTYFSGIRQLMRGKLLRIRGILSPETQSGDVALDDATMADARAKLAYLESLGSVNTTVRSWIATSAPGGNEVCANTTTGTSGAPPVDDRTPRERTITEALGDKVMQAQQLADASGYPNNSSFRTTLSNLVKRHHLKKSPDGDGYLRCQ